MQVADVKKYKYALTHSGTFHADDVFSSAFLKIINPNLEIIRSNTVPADFEGIVYDMGGGEFDHHGLDNDTRPNAIPYAAFGKLWRAFAPELYGEYVSKKIDTKLIADLDYSDNTGFANSLCLAISVFNPTNNSSGDQEFRRAVDLAKEILENLIKHEQINYQEELKVKEIYDNSLNKEIIVLDEKLHFTDTLPNTKAIYVIYPSNRGGYMAQGVPQSSDTVLLKKNFPKSWLTNLPDYLLFCHKSLFLIHGNTLDDVKKACEVALKEEL